MIRGVVMFISDVTRQAGRVGVTRRRIGRGIGSHGKTSGRGHKGESSRSGAKRYALKEGGQMPYFRKVAKRGFDCRVRRALRFVAVLDIVKFESLVGDVGVLDVDALREMGLVPRDALSIRLVGNCVVNRPLNVAVSHASRAATQSIIRAGGIVVVV